MKLKIDRNDLAALTAKMPNPTDKLHFVKDDGIYLMSFAAPLLENGKRPIAYAKGYNPEKDGDIWEKCRAAVGGDDIGEEIGTRADFDAILADSEGDIILNVTASLLSTSYLPKRTPEQAASRIKVLNDFLAKTKAPGAPDQALWSPKFKRTVSKAKKELAGLTDGR